MGVANQSITAVIKERRKSAGGFIFKYAEISKVEGEVWKNVIIKDVDSGAFVSNKARFQDANGVIKTISPPSDGCRKGVMIYMEKIIPFQSLFTRLLITSVCTQKLKGVLKKGNQVDHIDEDKNNDNPDNL